MKILSIVLLIILVLALVVGLILSISEYKKNAKESFSFLNEFPNELLLPYKVGKNKPYIISTFILCILQCLVVTIYPFVLSMSEFSGFILPMASIGIVFGAASAINFMFLNFVYPENSRLHLKAYAFFQVTSVFYEALLVVTFIDLFMVENSISSMIIFIISCLAFISMLSILINPKLGDWGRLEKNINDGKESYSRGKVFILAFSEWTTFLSNLIFIILTLLVFLFIL